MRPSAATLLEQSTIHLLFEEIGPWTNFRSEDVCLRNRPVDKGNSILSIPKSSGGHWENDDITRCVMSGSHSSRYYSENVSVNIIRGFLHASKAITTREVLLPTRYTHQDVEGSS